MLDIEKIEKKYNFKDLKYKNIYIWPYLRGVYGSKSLYKNRGIRPPSIRKRVNIYFKNIFSMHYGLSNLFRSYKYMVFGDTDSLKLIDGKYGDRMAHHVMTALGIDKILYLESPNTEEFYPMKKCHYYKTSEGLLYLITKIVYIIFSLQRKYSSSLLDTINKEFNLHVNYDFYLKKFDAEYLVYQLFFKIYKPKVVFVTCFTRRTLIKAANDLKIITVEFQHGVISGNYAYNNPIKKYYSFYSKYLLVYGENDKNFFDEYNYIADKNNIFTIGNYYINYIKNTDISIPLVRKYKYKVIVSLQTSVAEEMNIFLQNVAKKLNDVLFIVVPRANSDLDTLVLGTNIKRLKNLNCYEIANACDIHLSVYSSCVIETPAFGLTNIFINFNNLSEYYYSKYIETKSYNYLVENEDQFVKLLQTIRVKDKMLVCEEHNDYFASNKKAIKNFINIIKKDARES